MKKLILIFSFFITIPLIYTQEIRVISVADVSFPTSGSGISQSDKIKKIKFQVNGVCEMCKNRIETALDVKGIRLADWNIKTKFCRVKFNSEIISENDIHKLISEVGHDTPLYRAKDKDYNSLYHCCHYTRKNKL
jgi:copper chaperone CopZ|tara:strand:- start:29 stop:433 length:405 start_codon:yes stop_codon:yes gene_type:complete